MGSPAVDGGDEVLAAGSESGTDAKSRSKTLGPASPKHELSIRA